MGSAENMLLRAARDIETLGEVFEEMEIDDAYQFATMVAARLARKGILLCRPEDLK